MIRLGPGITQRGNHLSVAPYGGVDQRGGRIALLLLVHIHQSRLFRRRQGIGHAGRHVPSGADGLLGRPSLGFERRLVLVELLLLGRLQGRDIIAPVILLRGVVRTRLRCPCGFNFII